MFNLIKIKKSVRWKMVASFAFAILILLTVSLLSYSSLSGLINVISEEAIPDRQLIIIRGIQGDLADAESSVRTYTLTKDEEYLDPYYLSVGSISDKIDSLRGIYKEGSRQVKIVDSVDHLINRKYKVMDKLIQFESGGNVNKVIDRISYHIKNTNEEEAIEKEIKKEPERNKDTADDTKEEDDDKKGFFGELFLSSEGDGSEGEKENQKAEGKEQQKNDSGFLGGGFLGNEKDDGYEPANNPIKEENAERKEVTTVPNTIVSKEQKMQRAISQIKKDQQKQREAQEHEELVLTRMDQQIMDQLRELFQVLEKEAVYSSKIKAREAAQSAILTKNIITGLSIGAFLLLIVLGYVIYHDVSRNARYRHILRIAKDRALELAGVKEDFLANISHEIRTPMNAIVGYTQLLQDTRLDKKQKEYLRTIDNSSRHLNTIVNDVLDYSKLESGKLTFEKIGYRPADVLDEVFDSLKQSAESKGLLYKKHYENPVSEVLIGDPVRLKQVLYNIVGNAIKFTEEGEVLVDITVVDAGPEKADLILRVSDTGIGMSEDKIKNIFKDFHQADSSTTRKFGGTGLGLAITKKLVDLQDGDIEVESEEGKGSVFTVKVPYRKGTKEDVPGSDDVKYTYKALEGVKILVAEDDEYSRTLLKNIFDKWKVDLILAENAEKAFELARKVDFDIYLLDLHMPGMNGLELTRKIRDELRIDKPVLALTAAVSRKDNQQCYDAGMDDTIKKPFRINELYGTLLKQLGIEDEEKDEKQKNSFSQRKNGKTTLELNSLKTVSGGDKEFMVEMLNLFITSAEKSVEGMSESLENEDWKSIQKIAHKLSPSARHIGLAEIAGQLTEMEKKIIKNDLSGIEKMTMAACAALNDIIPELKRKITDLKTQ